MTLSSLEDQEYHDLYGEKSYGPYLYFSKVYVLATLSSILYLFIFYCFFHCLSALPLLFVKSMHMITISPSTINRHPWIFVLNKSTQSTPPYFDLFTQKWSCIFYSSIVANLFARLISFLNVLASNKNARCKPINQSHTSLFLGPTEGALLVRVGFIPMDIN